MENAIVAGALKNQCIKRDVLHSRLARGPPNASRIAGVDRDVVRDGTVRVRVKPVNIEQLKEEVMRVGIASM